MPAPLRHLLPGILRSMVLTALLAALPLTSLAKDEAGAALSQRAEAGDPEAQFQLGLDAARNYARGRPLPHQATHWLKKAAAQDHLAAIILLADVYASYPQLGADAEEYADLLGRAADLGHVASSARLGRLLWDGASHFKENRPEAYRRLREAALGSSEGAVLFLAEHALSGEGVKRDPAAARLMLNNAAKRGSTTSEMLLLVLNEQDSKFPGFSWVARKVKKLGEQGNPRALRVLARAYETGGAVDADWLENTSLIDRHKQARIYYEKAAKLGDLEAATRLGLLHLKGRGGPASLPLARQCFEQAAAAGQPLAQYHLAVLMLERRVQGDAARIRELLESAAVTDPNARFELGMVMYEGNQTARDPQEASRQFEQAAHAGHALACINLGVMAAKGETGPADSELAAYWWTMAVMNGSSEGEKYLASLGGRTSPKAYQEYMDKIRRQHASRPPDSDLQWPELELKK